MLALALGGRTVSELQQSMTLAEFNAWREFYVRWPFDDFSRFHRPAALVSVSLSGGDVTERLEWLQPTAPDKTGADADIFRLARKKRQ